MKVTGFTPSEPAPSAIEGHVDGIISAADGIREIKRAIDMKKYNGILVACFSDHPLTKALREEFEVPVIGIMEAAIYTARMISSRFGIVTTGERSLYMHLDAVRNYGVIGYCAGAESSKCSVLELESKPKEYVLGRMGDAALKLVNNNMADCILLGCAGMAEMKKAIEEAVPEGVRVLDGVECGVHLLVAMARMGIKTAKQGMYRPADIGRKNRNQLYF